MTLGERILFFIRQFYGSQTKFAEAVDIHMSVLSRYISNKSLPGWEMLQKFHDAGMSLDWLMDEQGPVFANNSRGAELRLSTAEIENRYSGSPYDRILGWINDNYGSLQNFSYIMGTEYEELYNIFFGDYLPGPTFVSDLVKAGCNLEWLSTGKGNPYSQNPLGRFLLVRHISENKDKIDDDPEFEELKRNVEEHKKIEFYKAIRNVAKTRKSGS
jgi:transcriptional regulator with XRE-family HTH domain